MYEIKECFRVNTELFFLQEKKEKGAFFNQTPPIQIYYIFIISSQYQGNLQVQGPFPNMILLAGSIYPE